MRRRSLLGWSLCAALGACGGEGLSPLPPLPTAVTSPDLIVGQLTDVLTLVDLSWVLLLRPQRLARTEWLRPSLSRVLKDERLDLVAKTTGLDLRECPELAVARYGADVTLQLTRHHADPQAVEKQFRRRLTSNERRAELGHQAVSVWGDIGQSPHGFVSIGVDVAGFQYGGDEQRGPGRVALLYALGKLETVPSVLDDETLRDLHASLANGGIPVAELLFPGPFEGELARGARGLLAGSTGVGVALMPTARETMQLSVLIAGDFGAAEDKALSLLEASWTDLATSDLGHLLGLHEPKVPPKAVAIPVGLALGVELAPDELFRGLAAATIDDVEAIMR